MARATHSREVYKLIKENSIMELDYRIKLVSGELDHYLFINFKPKIFIKILKSILLMGL